MFHRLNRKFFQVLGASYITYVALNVAWFSFFMKSFYLEKFVGVVNPADITLGTYFTIFSNPKLLVLLAWALVITGLISYALPCSKGNYQAAFVSGAIYGLIVSGSHQILSFALIAHWPVEGLYASIPWMMFACAATTAVALYTSEKVGYSYMV